MLTFPNNMGHLLVARQAEAIATLLMNREAIIKVIDNGEHLTVSRYGERFGDQNLMLTGKGGYSHARRTALADIATQVIIR